MTKYRIPAEGTVDRVGYLTLAVRGRAVLHLGAAQGTDRAPLLLHTSENFQAGFLHAHLMRSAANVVGLDYNLKAIENLRGLGYQNIAYCDVTDKERYREATTQHVFDVIVIGELIEHLGSPGEMLSNIVRNAKSGTELVITTPNLLSITYLLQALRRHESHDVDHVVGFTPRLLEALCLRYGIEKKRLLFYRSDVYRWRVLNMARRAFLKFFPQLSDGLVFHGVINDLNDRSH